MPYLWCRLYQSVPAVIYGQTKQYNYGYLKSNSNPIILFIIFKKNLKAILSENWWKNFSAQISPGGNSNVHAAIGL
jgi:hypothetical protein